MIHASLFSGGGGFDLASEWMGWENAFNCEINPFCRKILKYYWPNAISYEDITRTDFTIWRHKIDILTGGFPCQGFSVAGLRAGTEDHRFLWPEMRRAYNECKPPWVVCENVTGLLTMEDGREISKDVFFKVENSQVVRLQEVDLYNAVYIRQAKMLIESICHDFEEDGYEVQTFNIPSAGVEAPHRRERVWIIAYSKHNGSYEAKRRESYGEDSHRSKKGKDGTKQSKGISEPEKLGTIPGSSAHSASSGGRKDTKGGLDESRELLQGQKREEDSNKSIRDEQGKSTTNPNGPGLQKGQLDGSEVQGSNREGGDSTINKSKVKEYGNASDSSNARLQRSKGERGPGKEGESNGHASKLYSRNNWYDFPTQSPVCSGDDGLSGRLDGITFSNWRTESIKMFGNAVVPDIPYEFFKIINQI